MIRTYRYRLKDGNHLGWLVSHARSVNLVWNWCNDAQRHALRHNLKWPRAFDLSNLAAGSGKMLDLHSQTIQAICERYAQSRTEVCRSYLRYRGRKALGWIPFKASGIRIGDGAVIYGRRRLRFWKSRDIPADAKITVGSFSANAAGHWFVNITMELPDSDGMPASGEIGLDFGLKDKAVGSGGERIEASSFYRELEPRLAVAQRDGKKRQVRNIHLRIANRRRDANHKFSTTIAKASGLIVIGGLSPAKLARTRMAKSVLDQGWSDLKEMLRYKAIGRAGIFLEVNEAYTTQTCSTCYARCGPRGLEGLRMREWICEGCGTIHDRDVNAAKNILRLGHETLSGGSFAL